MLCVVDKSDYSLKIFFLKKKKLGIHLCFLRCVSNVQSIKVKNQVQVKKDQNCRQKDIISRINRIKRGDLMKAEGMAVTKRTDGTRWRGNKFTVHYKSSVLVSHNSGLVT